MIHLRSPVRPRSVGVLAVGLAVIAAAAARADIIVSYQDVGSDLQFSWSGSLSALPGGNAPGGPVTLARISSPNTGSTLQDFYALGGNYDRYGYSATRTPSGTGLFGSTFSAITGTSTGDTFAVGFPSTGPSNLFVFLPPGYQVNDPVVGTLTIPGASVASTGLSDVSFALGTGGNIAFRAVPEPAALTLAATAAAAVIGFRQIHRRRPRKPTGSA